MKSLNNMQAIEHVKQNVAQKDLGNQQTNQTDRQTDKKQVDKAFLHKIKSLIPIPFCTCM